MFTFDKGNKITIEIDDYKVVISDGNHKTSEVYTDEDEFYTAVVDALKSLNMARTEDMLVKGAKVKVSDGYIMGFPWNIYWLTKFAKKIEVKKLMHFNKDRKTTGEWNNLTYTIDYVDNSVAFVSAPTDIGEYICFVVDTDGLQIVKEEN